MESKEGLQPFGSVEGTFVLFLFVVLKRGQKGNQEFGGFPKKKAQPYGKLLSVSTL